LICERGGCPGSGGNNPHPIYAVLLMVPVMLVLAGAKYLGLLTH
jgi:hypothetical protein